MSTNKKPGKKYRPKPCLPNPVSWVLNGMLPVTTADVEVRRLRTVNHSALFEMVHGRGTKEIAFVLNGAFVTARAIAEIGKGRDWLPEINLGRESVDSMLLRGEKTGRYLFTGPELNAVNLAMEVHDTQIDKCTIGELERAVKLARKKMKV